MKTAKKPMKKVKKTPQSIKTKFRSSKQWRVFREKKKKEQVLDPITEKPLSKTFNLHHCCLDENKYTDISNEENFVGLNSQSHDVVHFFFGDVKRKKNWRKMVLNLIKILKKMDKLN